MSDIENEAEYLKPTFEKLGELIPVFRSPDGEVIDGKHRLQVNPEWHSHTIETLTDPAKKAMARLVVNVVRRKVPAEEKTELLGQIAKLTGWTPQQIADAIGMSYTWVIKYLPEEFKKRTWKQETPITRRVIKQEDVKKVDLLQQRPERVNCEKCHVGVLYPKEWKGHILCSVCYERAERGEFDKKRQPQEPEAPSLEEKPNIDEEPDEPTETWEITVTMKKPYTDECLMEPTKNAVLESFADAIIHKEIDDYFEITIKKVEK